MSGDGRIRVHALGADPGYRERPTAQLRVDISPRRGPAVALGALALASLAGVGALVHGSGGDDGRSWSLFAVLTAPFWFLLFASVLTGLVSRIEIAVERDAIVIREPAIRRTQRIARREVRDVVAGPYGERAMLHLVLASGETALACDIPVADAEELADAAAAIRSALELEPPEDGATALPAASRSAATR